MSPPVRWTPERDETLRRMWKLGHSSREIAEKLGTTPNAVIGRANRLHLNEERKRRIHG